jgi:hypothetical protein
MEISLRNRTIRGRLSHREFRRALSYGMLIGYLSVSSEVHHAAEREWRDIASTSPDDRGFTARLNWAGYNIFADVSG